jgi:UDP-glucose:(heptosyl)LPS alpha-1,3-glucosyltransferase
MFRVATAVIGRRKMKLGFILFDYFPFGGLQRDCVKIARTCAARGHSVTLLTRTWQGDKPADLDIAVLGRRGFSNISRNRHFLRQLDSRLPALEFDGVVGFNKMPGLDVYFGADPCYLARIQRTQPWWCRWLPRYRHFASLERAVFARGVPTQIMLLAPQEIPVYRSYYDTEDRFHVLPPNVTRRTFSADEQAAARRRLRAENNWPANGRLLVFVGSDFKRKGLDRALRALAALPAELRANTRLAVLGQDGSRSFQRLAASLKAGAQVHFLGGRHDVPDWMMAADALIHPAHSETAGMVLVEALTFGLPVLTTDVCGYAFHIAKAGAGIVLPSPFNPEQCNSALVEMLTSDKSSAWRTNGLAYAAKEDLYSCHERAADIIEQTSLSCHARQKSRPRQVTD